MLMCTCEGTVTGFGLANPKLYGERDQARQMLTGHAANRRPRAPRWSPIRASQAREPERIFTSPALGLDLIRPRPAKTKSPRYFPNWLRQRIEAIIWTLKNQLGLERHGGQVPAGL